MRDQIDLTKTPSAKVDFQMRLATICECVDEGLKTLKRLWEASDAVVASGSSVTIRSAGMPVQVHTAAVLTAWKLDPA